MSVRRPTSASFSLDSSLDGHALFLDRLFHFGFLLSKDGLDSLLLLLEDLSLRAFELFFACLSILLALLPKQFLVLDQLVDLQARKLFVLRRLRVLQCQLRTSFGLDLLSPRLSLVDSTFQFLAQQLLLPVEFRFLLRGHFREDALNLLLLRVL